MCSTSQPNGIEKIEWLTRWEQKKSNEEKCPKIHKPRLDLWKFMHSYVKMIGSPTPFQILNSTKSL